VKDRELFPRLTPHASRPTKRSETISQPQTKEAFMGRVVQVSLAGLLLVANAGCLVVAAGAAAGGAAAAGYVYFAAPVYQEFPLPLPDAAVATRAALADLQLPLVKEEPTSEGLEIESQTGDKKRIRIVLTARPQKVPTDGVVTRIAVRVATFGDEMVSGRILDQVQIHLPGFPALGAPVAQGAQASAPGDRLQPVPQGAPPRAPGAAVQPASYQSAEPPPAMPLPAAVPPSAVPQPIR
jgi:hypothetical protein